jgi:hypothetical protein
MRFTGLALRCLFEQGASPGAVEGDRDARFIVWDLLKVDFGGGRATLGPIQRGLDPQGYHANHPVQECPESTGTAGVKSIEHTPGSKALNEDFLGGIVYVLKALRAAPARSEVGTSDGYVTQSEQTARIAIAVRCVAYDRPAS